LIREYLLLKHVREIELTQSARNVSSANTDSTVPTKSCVSKIIKKWWTTGLGLDKTQHRKKTVLTDEKLEDIWRWLQISPWKFLTQLSQETVVSVGSVSKATKLIKFHPYTCTCA
jgi:hypothetical protein